MSLDSKHIGIVTWDFLHPKGGLGKAMQLIANALEEGGHTVSVFSPTTGMLPRTKRIGGHFLFSALLPFYMYKWKRNNGIDIIIYPSGPGGVFYFAPRNQRTIAVCYHNYAQQSSLVPGQGWKKLFIPLEYFLLKRAKGVLVYSKDTKQSLVSRYGIDPEHIFLLPQLFHCDEWEIGEPVHKKPFSCICVARLEKRKGVGYLLDAWQLVSTKYPKATLRIVGDGIERGAVDKKIAACSGSVTRKSHIPESELRTMIQESTLAICPSYLEGFGLFVLEAMCSGTAVIAHNVDGLRSLISHNMTGILVEAGDPKLLAAAIGTALEQQENRERIAAQAKEYAMSTFEYNAAKQALLSVVGTI